MSYHLEKEDTQPLLSDKTEVKDRREYTQEIPTYGTKEVKPRITRRKLLVVIGVLMTELCERLTYYSVVANIILFCTSVLNLSSADATRINLVFSGSVYIIPIFGGYVADAFAGKYNTIFGSALIYIVGLFLLPASAVDYEEWFGRGQTISIDRLRNDVVTSILIQYYPYLLLMQETRRVLFLSALVLIAICTGGIKASVGPFGAQQVDKMGPKAVQSFFNWYYWFINVGSVIAYSGVAAVQQNIGFDVGYLIPFISMVVALIIFVVNRKSYVYSPPEGSVLQDTIGVCCATKCQGFNQARKDNGGPYSDKMVDGVLSVLRILPIFLLVIMYYAIYSQMNTTFFLQSERMDIRVGSGSVPVAFLNVFNTIIIIILIPIMESLVYPFLDRKNRSPSHLQRIGTGMVLAAMAVFVAGILEIYRKKDISIINQKLADDTFNASSISVFAQIPQFTLIGASEVFTGITGLEFAYSQAPIFMQGVCMGLFLATSGFGNYVAELIIETVVAITGSKPPGSWFPNDINKGKTEYLFFLLGILMIVDFIVFVVVAYFYKYKKHDIPGEVPDEVDINVTSPPNPITEFSNKDQQMTKDM